MGQSVSAVMKAAMLQNEEAEKMANDALTALHDVAKLQNQLFRSQLANNDARKIPIKKTIFEDTIIRCSVDPDNRDEIAKEVKNMYSQFASEDAAEAIGSVLSINLKNMFANAAGNSNQYTNYFITMGSLPDELFRVDMMVYTYAFTSDALSRVTNNVVAITVVVSSVDKASLDKSAIGAAVQYCYGNAPEEVQKKIFDKLMAVRDSN
ncbi:tyrosine phosphatase protein [Cladorrhinum samala]|uniref:Tyrosine phosphatase protein n=1 Tax=Cladorrhinum samala TaxID=585594 RepID=A0AAV9HIV0_9PEZI|nr:tyrosine phosphatase protein [Cladorrhinum samala]